MKRAPAAHARERSDASRTSGADIAVVAALMAVHIASSVFGAAGPDTARDVAAALAIADGDALPLHGPLLAGTSYLGPVWFYLLALPLAVHRSWLAVALFVAVLGSLQFPLAYAAGRRGLDRRYGLLWCALLALPGWGSFQMVGFSHTNLVATCSMLVLYALVRLDEERRARWLIVAAAALSLALHAHPTTIGLAPIIALAALLVLPVGALLRGGAVAIVIAALPFAPLLADRKLAGASLAAQAGDYLRGTMHAANLEDTGALLSAFFVRGPHTVADAFLSAAPPVRTTVVVAVLALELAGLVGLVFAAARRPLRVVALLLATLAIAALIAWLRPATPFYMTYALLPFTSALLALGLHALCAGSSERGRTLAASLIAVIFAVYAASAVGIAATIAAGDVTVAVATRLDIKRDDAVPPVAEPWLAAHAVDASGELLCGFKRAVVLHGAYAFLEQVYLGLDHRLHCDGLDVRLAGVEPATAVHLLGLARPAWQALGWTPQRTLGGIGVAADVHSLWPPRGLPPPDGSVYPPATITAAPLRTMTVDASLPASEALVVALPYVPWMDPPQVSVSANGAARAPLARDVAAAVYACRECAGNVTWRITISSAAPERVDVVSFAPAKAR